MDKELSFEGGDELTSADHMLSKHFVLTRVNVLATVIFGLISVILLIAILVMMNNKKEGYVSDAIWPSSARMMLAQKNSKM